MIKKKVNNKSPVFASKSQRPEFITQHTSCMLGPGTYSKEKNEYKPFQTKSPKSSIHYTLSQSEVGRTEGSELGPGSYKYQSVLDSDKFRKRETLGTIAKSERFSFSLPAKVCLVLFQKTNPGPGEYNQVRFTMIQEQDLRFKSKGSFARKP